MDSVKMQNGLRTILITPEMAEEWLLKNTSNRKMSHGVVKKYAEIMSDGNWVVNGESIKFDSEGMLIDGQHRLQAIVLYKKPVLCDVRFGLKHEIFDSLDSGKSRKASEVLSIGNYQNTRILATSIKCMMSYNKNKKIKGKSNITNHQVLSYLDYNPSIVETVDLVVSLYKEHKIGLPVTSVSMIEIIKKDNPLIYDFVKSLHDGIGLTSESPIYLLRERLIKLPKSLPRKLELIFAYYIKSWNAFITNERLKLLKYSFDEEYPIVITDYKNL